MGVDIMICMPEVDLDAARGGREKRADPSNHGEVETIVFFSVVSPSPIPPQSSSLVDIL